jgi:hypothetical protein
MMTLKWIGAAGAIAIAAALFEKKRNGFSELETAADRELKKILLYAAPPTFLAPVSVVHEERPQRRWADRIAR